MANKLGIAGCCCQGLCACKNTPSRLKYTQTGGGAAHVIPDGVYHLVYQDPPADISGFGLPRNWYSGPVRGSNGTTYYLGPECGTPASSGLVYMRGYFRTTRNGQPALGKANIFTWGGGGGPPYYSLICSPYRLSGNNYTYIPSYNTATTGVLEADDGGGPINPAGPAGNAGTAFGGASGASAASFGGGSTTAAGGGGATASGLSTASFGGGSTAGSGYSSASIGAGSTASFAGGARKPARLFSGGSSASSLVGGRSVAAGGGILAASGSSPVLWRPGVGVLATATAAGRSTASFGGGRSVAPAGATATAAGRSTAAFGGGSASGSSCRPRGQAIVSWRGGGQSPPILASSGASAAAFVGGRHVVAPGGGGTGV